MVIHPWKQQTNSQFTLKPGEMQLWYANLEKEDPTQFLETLSPEEHARATRLKTSQLTKRFINTHGILRSLLGHYVAQPPDMLVFQYGAQGKPSLVGHLSKQYTFNLSHSGDLAIYVIANGLEVGVDIEKIHTVPELDEIASSYFSFQEQNQLKNLPGLEKLTHFFALWTCKEAVLKAAGQGLGFSTNRFTVELCESEARLADPPIALTHGREYRLALLSPSEGYVGALAYFDTN
jgi:4'-phosphopantetheinyl transferase